MMTPLVAVGAAPAPAAVLEVNAVAAAAKRVADCNHLLDDEDAVKT